MTQRRSIVSRPRPIKAKRSWRLAGNRMNRFYHIIGVALLCWLTYLLTAGQSSSFPGSRTEETTGPSEVARWGVRTRGPAGQDPRTQARIDKLSRLEIERGMRDRPPANMQQARIVLRLQGDSARSEI